MRMRLFALVAAASLTFGLGACSTGSTPVPASSTAQASAAQGGQSTPEAAAQSWLRAYATGDAHAVCSSMATKSRALEGNETGLKLCEQTLKGTLERLSQYATEMKGATVTGATINGDIATFENATVTPALAKDVLTNMSAAKVNGKWYITTTAG